MRVLYVIQELAAGGAERVVLALSRGAQSAGHHVAVAAAPGALSAELAGTAFELPLLERRLSRLPGAALALRRALREARPDVVHVHNPGMSAVASLATGRGRTAKALVSVHGVPDGDYAAAARVLRLAGLPAVACGPGVAAALASAGLHVRTTIVNGVGPPPPPASRAAIAAEWGLRPEQTLVLAVGRLVRQKNHAAAVRALSSVPDAALVIVGEGPLADELLHEAGSLGIGDRLVLAGARPDARSLIGAADVVVLPSRWEGLPLVALEALAAGRPLVATTVRGVRELVTDGEDALLVPPDDPAALAAALTRAISEPGLAERLAARAPATARRYSEDSMIQAYLRLYEELATS
jgi:glycosyltransferase involved in cell wall biosynthesis